jgi:acetoacetyl-CoA synthetase
MTDEGALLWQPSPEFASSSNIAGYLSWLNATGRTTAGDYHELWQWSVTETEAFWASIWDYYQVESATPYTAVVDELTMPGAAWFPGARVNYAEHLLRYARTAREDEVVFHHASELRPLARLGWRELARQVRVVATRLRELGIEPGDRVVSYLPNVPETAIAMMATVAVGAVWSSAAPEFGVRTVIERFGQIEPKLILVADGYRFGGKGFDRTEEVRAIVAGLPTLRTVVWLPYLDETAAAPTACRTR